MPPPAWQQQLRQVPASPANASTRQRRRSMETVVSPKQNTTATYTAQYLQRRRSQQGLADAPTNSQQLQTNGDRLIERRRSSAELCTSNEQLNGLESPPPQSKTLENGHEKVASAVVDSPVEKKAPNPIEAGKGLAVLNGGNRFAPTNSQDKENTALRASMAKKRRAPGCKRRYTVLAAVAGAVTVSMAGGIAVCRLYPSSPAAVLMRLAADSVGEGLHALLVDEVGPFTKQLGDVVYAKWLVLLRNGRLEETAQAAEELLSGDLQTVVNVTGIVNVCFKLVDVTRTQLTPAFLTSVDALSVRWIWTRLKTVFEFIALEMGDNELLERLRSFLLLAFSSLVEALLQGGQWMKSNLDQMFEKDSNVSDGNLPSDQFLAPLLASQAAIQQIGRGLTAQEVQALEDVKRFEKQRVTITSATNSIIADTRLIALESIADVKMAAMESMEERIKQLAEQYAKSYEQVRKDYERTSHQIEREGGTENAGEDQALLDAAASLIRDFTLQEKTTDTNSVEPPVLEEQIISNDESQQKLDDQAHVDIQLVEEEQHLPEELPKSPELADQGSSEGVPGSDADIDAQIVVELAKEVLMPDELAEVSATVHDSSEETLGHEHVDALLNAAAFVEKTASALEDALVGGHDSDDQAQIIAQLAEKDLPAEKESMDIESIGKVEEPIVTEVTVGMDNAVLEMEHTQMTTTTLLEAQNLSEVENSKQEVELQEETQPEAVLRVSVDGSNVELVMELGARTGEIVDEQVQLKRVLPDVRTRFASQAGVEKEAIEEKLETEVMKESNKLSLVEDKISVTDETRIEVRREQMDTKTVLKVDKEAAGSEPVAEEFKRTEEAELASSHSHDAAVAEMESQVQTEDVVAAIEAQQEHTVGLRLKDEGTSGETEALETERVVVAKEIQELEQLEQALLHDESERVRVEKELRVIAEEEELWLQNEQSRSEEEAYQKVEAADQHSAATIDVTKPLERLDDLTRGIRQPILGMPAPAAPSPALMQIGLLSAMFLSCAGLAAYLLLRHRKRGSFAARAPRRRWKRLVDMDESDAEEVVLLPDDSSDEEEEDDDMDHAVQESSLDVVETESSVQVDATAIESFEGEEAEEREGKPTDDREDAEENENMVKVENEEKDGVIKILRSRTVVAHQVTTHVMDHPGTPNSDALADSDAANATITTPSPSRQETPDTSHHNRRPRRHRETTTNRAPRSTKD